jgi:hypothetical protein
MVAGSVRRSGTEPAMVGGDSEWTSPAPYTTAVTAPRTRPRSRACDSLCRRPIQTSAADPIANTASTAQCEGPYAENARFAEISPRGCDPTEGVERC